jgi:hypothetical protein
LDADDRLSLREPPLEVGVLPVGPRQFRRHRVDGGFLRPPLQRLQSLEGARIALTAPIRQGVQAFPTQNGRDPAGIRRVIRLRQNPQFLTGCKRPALRTVR